MFTSLLRPLACLGLVVALLSPASGQTEAPTVVRKQPRQLVLSWTPTDGSVYTVWRKLGSKGEWRALKEVAKPHFVDQALLPRTIAYYKIAIGETMSAVSGPHEALDDFYVELIYVSKTVARLHFHQWRENRNGWARSLALDAKKKEMLAGSDVVGDFQTQIKVLKVGKHPTKSESEAELEFVKLLTPDHRLVQVTTRDKVPLEVYDPEPKKTKAKKAKAEKVAKAKRVRKRRSKTRKPIKFPQPKLVSQLPKKRLEWEIVNKSKYKMHVIIRGRNSHNFKIGPDSTYVVRFTVGGDYKVMINAVGDDLLALESKFGLVQGNRYQSVFAIKVLDESDPRVKEKRRNP
ncbi:MAG: hypothetical protein JKY65_23310 [Planctomycetes bacterium]|nr:hypothetical protein [Planctomycetota bacterium]